MNSVSRWVVEKIRATGEASRLGESPADTVRIFYLLFRWQILKRAEFLRRIFPVPLRLRIRCNNQTRTLFVAPDINFTDVLYEVLLRRDYLLEYNLSPEVIFDIGACYGISTAFLSCRYPEARIFAFEPSPKTFRFLSLNTAGVRNIRIFNKAVYTYTGTIKFYSDGEHGGWNTVLPLHRSHEEVACVSLDDFIKQHDIGQIDLLKIDVEGAELEIFKTFTGLEKISFMAGELHYLSYRHADIMAVLGRYFNIRIIPTDIKNPAFHAVNKNLNSSEPIRIKNAPR